MITLPFGIGFRCSDEMVDYLAGAHATLRRWGEGERGAVDSRDDNVPDSDPEELGPVHGVGLGVRVGVNISVNTASRHGRCDFGMPS